MEQDGIYYFFEHEDGKHTLVLADPSRRTAVPGLAKSTTSRHRRATSASGAHLPLVNPSAGFDRQGRAERLRLPEAQRESAPASENRRSAIRAPTRNLRLPRQIQRSETTASSTPRCDSRPSRRSTIAVTGRRRRQPLSRRHSSRSTSIRQRRGERPYLVVRSHARARRGRLPLRRRGATPPRSLRQLRAAAERPAVPPAARDTEADRSTACRRPSSSARRARRSRSTSTAASRSSSSGIASKKPSCWVRVSQNWAGKRWGAMFIPRIGQEVRRRVPRRRSRPADRSSAPSTTATGSRPTICPAARPAPASNPTHQGRRRLQRIYFEDNQGLGEHP